MKKKILIIAVTAAIVCVAAGCQSKSEEIPPLTVESIQDTGKDETQDSMPEKTETQDTDAENTDTENTVDEKENTNEKKAPGNTKDVQHSSKEENTGEAPKGHELLGNVTSIGEKHVTVNRVFTENTEDGGMLAVSNGDGEETLVDVYFNETATYQFQEVRNGGEDVKRREASYDDIQDGLLLRMTGSWNGESFYADTVTISKFY